LSKTRLASKTVETDLLEFTSWGWVVGFEIYLASNSVEPDSMQQFRYCDTTSVENRPL
jgi:hypothetical protein